MTQREFYSAVAEANISEDITTYANAQVAKLDERNKAKKNETSKRQAVNKELAEKILDSMENGVTYTASEIVGLGIDGVISTQKATPLMKILAEEGTVTITEVSIKGKGKVKGYTRIETEEITE
jgi:hypothetical protein